MSKLFQVYGIGQGLIPVLPPPLPFENPPTVNQTNYEIGQLVFTPPKNPTSFWLYAGSGSWIEFATAGGDVLSVTGTANQILASPTTGSVVLSLIGPYTPATYTAHGVLIGEGTGSIVATAAGTTGQVLTATSAADPAFAAIGTNSGLTAHGVLIGENLSAFAATAAGTTGQVLTATSAADPAFAALGVNSGLTAHGVLLGENLSAIAATAAGTNGQVLLGSTTADPAFGTITTSTGLAFTLGAHTLNIDLANGGYAVVGAATGGVLATQTSNVVVQAGQASFALPASASVGSIFMISSAQSNAGGWIITQADGQEIWLNTNHTTGDHTGTLAGARSTSVTLMCTVANSEFLVVASTGVTGLTFS